MMCARGDGGHALEWTVSQPVQDGHRTRSVVPRAVTQLSVAVETPAARSAVTDPRARVVIARNDLCDSPLRSAEVQHLHRQETAGRRAVTKVSVRIDAPAARRAVGDPGAAVQ